MWLSVNVSRSHCVHHCNRESGGRSLPLDLPYCVASQVSVVLSRQFKQRTAGFNFHIWFRFQWCFQAHLSASSPRLALQRKKGSWHMTLHSNGCLSMLAPQTQAPCKTWLDVGKMCFWCKILIYGLRWLYLLVLDQFWDFCSILQLWEHLFDFKHTTWTMRMSFFSW